VQEEGVGKAGFRIQDAQKPSLLNQSGAARIRRQRAGMSLRRCGPWKENVSRGKGGTSS